MKSYVKLSTCYGSHWSKCRLPNRNSTNAIRTLAYTPRLRFFQSNPFILELDSTFIKKEKHLQLLTDWPA